MKSHAAVIAACQNELFAAKRTEGERPNSDIGFELALKEKSVCQVALLNMDSIYVILMRHIGPE